MILKISQNSLEWDSSTGVFLWILQNFKEFLINISFYRTLLANCFYYFCDGYNLTNGSIIYGKHDKFTAWEVSKYGVFSGPSFPVFGLNTEIYGVFSPNTRKYGPEKTQYLETFHAVILGGYYGKNRNREIQSHDGLVILFWICRLLKKSIYKNNDYYS